MTEILTFVAGLVAGALLILVLRRIAPAPAPSRAAVAEHRADSLTPLSVPVEDRDSLEGTAHPDGRFSSLCCELLEDVVAHHHAQAGAIWKLQGRELTLEVVAGDRSIVTSTEAALQPLIEWSAREGFVQLGPDGDAPIAGIAPLTGSASSGTRDARASGAMALIFGEPYAGDRTELKRWLHRYGERFARVGELVRTHDELTKTNKRTRTLLRETQMWDIEERPADLGVQLCAMVEKLTGAEGAALVRWDQDAQIGSVVIADGTCAQYAGSTVEEDSLAGTACREDVPKLWHDIGRGEGGEFLFSRSLPTQRGCVLVQPLRRRGSVIGAVVATHREPGALGSSEVRALSQFDAVASFRIASAWKLEEVSRRALVDGLTGLVNREGFEAEMRQALGEQMRYGWEMSLVIIDVDHFKLINDTHGHEVGDSVLRAIARVLDEGVRTTDVSARVGGEEMALILKDTGLEGALELSERLRAGIEALRFPFGPEEIRVTASFGVATYPTHVAEWAGLYRAADRALYEAKAAGRNQVRSEGEPVQRARAGR
jgi:diguanylate cyclase (GGDEF)-like protein